jgi:hypothetical protein
MVRCATSTPADGEPGHEELIAGGLLVAPQDIEPRWRVHERFTMLMSLCLDGVATRAERLELAQHVLVCPACATAWEQWKTIDQLLAMAPCAVPPRNLAVGVSLRLHQQASPNRKPAWLRVGALALGILSLTTSALVIAWLLWWGWHHTLELALLLSSGAETLSSVSWALAGIKAELRSLDGSGLKLSLATCVVCSGGLSALWLWALTHRGSSTGDGPHPEY